MRRMFLIRSIAYESKDEENTEEIFKAITEGNFEHARCLIGRTNNINYTDDSGATLISLVCKSCALETEAAGIDFIVYLLEKGADIDKKDKFGKTALDYAEDNGLRIIQEELTLARCIKEFF